MMDGGGEDRISNLPESVISHILSCLPTKDAMQTSILSKNWRHKWTSIYNIELDDRCISSREKISGKTFVGFIERVLHSTRNLSINCFHLLCLQCKLDPQYLGRCVARVLKRGVQNLEILTPHSEGCTIVDQLYNCRSLTKLDLILWCTLFTSRMRNCFLNLKILHLGHNVTLWNDVFSKPSEMLLNFPVMEELLLSCCISENVMSVEITAPSLIRFVNFVCYVASSNRCLIKIDGSKLKIFETYGHLLDNYDLVAPSISEASFTDGPQGSTLGFRAHALLIGFMSTLEYLLISTEIVKALTESNTCFLKLRFNRLKRLGVICFIDNEELTKLFQMMPSLESLALYVTGEELCNLPSSIASRLKVVKLDWFRGTPSQIQLAKSVLKNAYNLETLFVFVHDKPLMPMARIKLILSTCPKSSARATVEVK